MINRLKYIFKTIVYSLKHEGPLILIQNIFKFLPWKKHPSKLIQEQGVMTQIEYVYVTPIRILFKGWVSASKNIEQIIWTIDGKKFLMHYPVRRQDIATRYSVTENCGYLSSETLIQGNKISFLNCRLDITFSDLQTVTLYRDLSKLVEQSRYIPTRKGLSRSIYKSKSHGNNLSSAPVEILIPYKNKVELLRTLVHSIFRFTDHPDFSITLLDNGSEDRDVIIYVRELVNKHKNIKHISVPIAFNYAAIINIGIQASNAPYILLLNNDIEVISKGWLTIMTKNFEDPDVSVVGAKLLYPDQSIQHAGVVLSDRILTHHIWQHFPNYSQQDHHMNIKRKVSAVTGACMLIRKADIEKYGYFDQMLSVTLNDIDYCLNLLRAGKTIIYDPNVCLIHHESMSRGVLDTYVQAERTIQEVLHFRKKWKRWLRNGDPYA